MDKGFLEIIPVRECDFEEKDGKITILYVNKNPNFIDKYIFRKWASKPRKIDLDEIGSYIWLNCNGENTVKSIVELSREKFIEKIEPAEERIETFLTQLHRNKLITLYQKK